MRIVSLISGATEIICSLGLEENLVGRSHECDFPEWVKDLPVCTEPRFIAHASNTSVESIGQQALQESVSLHRIIGHRLRELTPDLIVTQPPGGVCGLTRHDVEQALSRCFPHQPRVVALQPKRLDDVWSDVRRIARAAGVEHRAEQCLADWQSRMQAVAQRANSWGRRPRVVCLESITPLIACGNWIPELVAWAGGDNLFGDPGEPAKTLRFEELCQADPDVLVVMPRGLGLSRIRDAMSALTRWPAWSQLLAVRQGHVWITEGNTFFNRPGPRLVESLEMLAEAINPAAFAFGHHTLENFA